MGVVHAIALLVAGIFLGQIMLLTGRHRLRDRHAFIWVLIGGVAFAAALGLPALNAISDAIGVAYMPSLVFLGAIYLILTLLMYQTMVLSSHQDGIRTMAQEIAYLRRAVETNQNVDQNRREAESPGKSAGPQPPDASDAPGAPTDPTATAPGATDASGEPQPAEASRS